jgi:hypothetical protein
LTLSRLSAFLAFIYLSQGILISGFGLLLLQVFSWLNQHFLLLVLLWVGALLFLLKSGLSFGILRFKLGYILPSRANIRRFVVSIVDGAWQCPFCKCPLETLSHIFLECDLVVFFWNFSPWPNCHVGFSNRPISDLVLAIIFLCEKLAIPFHDARRFQLFASITMDLIWFCRNMLIHDAVIPSPSKILHQIFVYLG